MCVCRSAVPSPPVIKPQQCVSSLDAALIRWDSGNTNPVESYTLEFHETSADGGGTATESVNFTHVADARDDRSVVMYSPSRHSKRSTFCPRQQTL